MNGSNKAPKADGDFSNAPYWNFNDGKLKFNSNWIDNANPNYGSASAALPVCLCPRKEPARVLFRENVSSRQAFFRFLGFVPVWQCTVSG